MQQLNDEQLESFDHEYIDDERWNPIKCYIDRDFPKSQFTFLDIGGGNGAFADRILSNYPNSQATILDNSQLLLDRNKYDERKSLIFDSVENIEARFTNIRFDLIAFNLVLHHLVANSSYSESLGNIDRAICSAKTLLTERGRILIYEQMFLGLFFDNLPSRIIYLLTSKKMIANLIRKAGANTAGVGVCYQSYQHWCSTIKRLGFHFEHTIGEIIPVPWIWNTFLNVKRLQTGYFWLRQ